jgi:murein DD-endopeptidase MepM/ murein hydrolase activator NlpD
MRSSKNAMVGLTSLILMATWVVSIARAAVMPLRQSFDIQIPWTPLPARIDGRQRVIYELHLTNFSRDSLKLDRVDVTNMTSGAVLHVFAGLELESMVGRQDRSVGKSDKLVIPPGVRAVIYVGLPIELPTGAECRLTHKIEFEVQSTNHERATVEGGRLVIHNAPMATIGAPLRDGPWVAVYNESWELGHRRVLYAIKGRVHVPGRFAIDWMKVDANGKYFQGDGSKVTDWFGYGAEVIAVSDGVVTATRDGVAENSHVVEGVQRTTLEDASGNYITLDLGDGRYAFYEHLKPGSIRVRQGDRVRIGSVIGQLGYTGQSTGPHLHFHVSDNNSPLDAEGLPYAVQRFRILGTYSSPAAFGKSVPWSPIGPGINGEPRGELPAPFSVVDFPD